jgi:phospholipase C
MLKEKKWVSWVALLALALSISLILAACGADGDDDSPGKIGANPGDSDDESASAFDVGEVPLMMLPSDSQVGLAKIQHFVFILQEDRSFDSYFGTFPGVEGIVAGTALTNPLDRSKVTLYHDSNSVDSGAPHSLEDAVRDINGGKMDGFLQNQEVNPKDVMGYHDYREIPNYWNYAMLYVLQDHLFAPSEFSSLASQLSSLAGQGNTVSPKTGIFDEISRLLNSRKFDWKYYDGGQNSAQFNLDARQGKLAEVSWVVPSAEVSEAPPASVRKGMAYVTGLVNAIMQGPEWYSTAIFISWDNFGGFYDHLAPPPFLEYTSAIRVPGLIISPYAKQNFIDHQTYSLESWLRIVEERFGVTQAASGNSSIVDMQDAFDFTQRPRVPIILAPTEGGSIFPQPLQHPEL